MTFNHPWRLIPWRLVSTLTRRGRHKRARLVTLRREKQCCFSENPTREQRGSKQGRMHDWRGSQALYSHCATSPSLRWLYVAVAVFI